METIQTQYGDLQGVSHAESYEDGSVKECMVTVENKLETSYGRLVPQYEQDGVRRKYTKSLSFHENGMLKSISLQEQIPVATSIGVFPAELLTFYESGRIKRVFPLNGKITGYWTEENEYGLAKEFEFHFAFGSFRKKIIGIHFYETGAVKSLTFWPRESLALNTSAGEMEVRIGMAFYPDGSVKSLEPHKPTRITTPIGELTAYDSKAVGIHGDMNSLGFDAEGKIKHLVTSAHRITVMDAEGKERIYEPVLKPSLLQPGKMSIEPLRISFAEGRVQFNGEAVYETAGCKFLIGKSSGLSGKCGDCASCSACE